MVKLAEKIYNESIRLDTGESNILVHIFGFNAGAFEIKNLVYKEVQISENLSETEWRWVVEEGENLNDIQDPIGVIIKIYQSFNHISSPKST